MFVDVTTPILNYLKQLLNSQYTVRLDDANNLLQTTVTFALLSASFRPHIQTQRQEPHQNDFSIR